MHAAGYIDNYYSRILDDQGARAPLSEDLQVDVCIIGGGLAGINTALGLCDRGVNNVALIEQNRIGWGASGRNGGFVAKGYAADVGLLTKKVGIDHAGKLVNLTKTARAMIRDRIATYDIPCGPLTAGVLTASWGHESSTLAQEIDDLNRQFDLGLEYWTTERVREHCKTTRYHNGLYSPNDFQFNSLAYVHGLARTLETKGVRLFENTKALSIKKQQGRWLVTTPQGTISARQLVSCCSVYSQGLDRRLEGASFPVQTYVMLTTPVKDADLAASINTTHAIYDTRFASDYYRVLPDKRILWGGRVGLWASPQNLSAVMIKDLIKVYPQLAGKLEPEVSWSGLLCYAPHRMPQIGMIEENYWYNTGFGGHGLVPTTVGGEVVAAALTGTDTTYKLFEPFGLGYAGGHMGRYVAQMVYWWWRSRDFLQNLKEVRA